MFELAEVSHDLREMVVTAEEHESIKYHHARWWLDRIQTYQIANADLLLTQLSTIGQYLPIDSIYSKHLWMNLPNMRKCSLVISRPMTP